jgi:prophage antirepressor-like protein
MPNFHTKKSGDIFKLMKKTNEYNESDNKEHQQLQIIDCDKSLFNYSDKQFSFIETNEHIYFRTKDIAEFLEYVNTKKSIIDHIQEKYKKTLGEIQGSVLNSKGNESLPLKKE